VAKPARAVGEAVAVADGTGFVGVGAAVTTGLEAVVVAAGVPQASAKAATVTNRAVTFTPQTLLV
jgi:hypothetical protein